MPKTIGRTIALFSTDEVVGTAQRRPSLSLKSLGVEGDKHFGKKLERSVLLTSLESYAMTEDALHLTMPYGYLGENILIDGDIYALPLGTKVRIGDQVVIEITQNCTLCSHLGVLDKRIPKLLKNHRGIFAKTVREGIVKEGDIVEVLSHDDIT
jgi:MOSC domain-containing protein YiiM